MYVCIYVCMRRHTQNVAEIDEIPFADTVVPLELPTAERAIYLELEHHLQALNPNPKP